MTFKLLLALVILSFFSIQNAQFAVIDDGLAKLQDPQLRLTLKSFETILSLLQAAPEGESVTCSQGGEQLRVATLISLAQLNLNKCTEDYFKHLVDLRKKFSQVPLATYIKNVITQQRRFCEQYLDEQVDSRVAAFSEPTRYDFELFLKHDRIGHDFYVSLEMSIVKMREILKLTDDELQQYWLFALAKSQYFTSCREITTQLEDLVPIRRDHDIFARLPMSRDRFFRAYEFCRNLVDINFSNELAMTLFLDVHSRTEIGRFGAHLAAGGAVGREQTINAARAFVREQSPLSRQTDSALAIADQRSERIINRLKAACTSSLDLTENLRWLRDHAPTGLKVDDAHLDARSLKYLRALEGCELLLELQLDQVLGHKTARTAQSKAASEDDNHDRKGFRAIIKKIFKFGVN